MAPTSIDTLLSYLRRLSPAAADQGDGSLLLRHAEGDETAFAALVRRYAPLVWGVCRRLLPCAQDAEDAFQATFVVLLRKARSLRRAGTLGPWLHRVAHRTATKARVQAARRSDREAAHTAAATTDGEPPGSDLREVLDEEVGRLPDKFRLPVVLCYLEGLSGEEAAARLGCAAGTIHSRLSRARERLRLRLSGRGVAVPTALFAALLSRASAEAAPARLVETPFHAGALSPAAITLAEGVLSSMFAQKLKWAALALAVVLFATGAGLFAYRQPGAAEGQTKPPAGAGDKAAARKGAEKQPGEKKTDKRPPPPPLADAELRQALAKTIDFPGFPAGGRVTLGEALKVLSDRYNVQFEIKDSAFRSEEITDVEATEIDQKPLRAMKAPLHRVLRQLLDRVHVSSGTTFLLRNNAIEITTEVAACAELGIKPEIPEGLGLGGLGGPGIGGGGIGFLGAVRLPTLVNEELRKVPLDRALRQIADGAEVNIVLDARVAKKAEVEVSARLTNVPVETALRVLTDMAGLDVVQMHNVLYVTTPENAARLEKTRARRDPGTAPGTKAPRPPGGAAGGM